MPLASSFVAPEQLSDQLKTFAIEFMILEYPQLEYRAHALANGAVIISTPRLEKIGDVSARPVVDVAQTSIDPFMLAHQVRAVMRLLQPQRALGADKIRLGNIGDGGYICLDDFAGIDTALSFGINDDIAGIAMRPIAD